MARADLLVKLAEVASRGDKAAVRSTVETIAAEEREKQHHILADRLMRTTRANGFQRPTLTSSRVPESGLLIERAPERALHELFLDDAVRQTVGEFVEEQQRADLLRSHGLEPRHKILLVGPPGNGKTSLAEAVASELGRPLLTPAYHRVVGSLLGETTGRLAKIFDEVRSRACVLFFDEIDVVAKERGDLHEAGEIKRVVSSLLLSIDALPPHVVVIGATNHAALLDRAVWRRFELRVEMPAPDKRSRTKYLSVAMGASRTPWGVSASKLAESLGDLSYGELEQFVGDIRRRMVLERPSSGRNLLRRAVTRWASRAGPLDS